MCSACSTDRPRLPRRAPAAVGTLLVVAVLAVAALAAGCRDNAVLDGAVLDGARFDGAGDRVPAAAVDAETLALAESRLGRRIEPFVLDDPGGGSYRLEDEQAELVVVAFLGAECPLARMYGPRLQDIARDYAARGVRVIGIFANVQDDAADVAVYRAACTIEFPLVIDADQAIAERFGALRTPEVFVLDRDRAVRYWGRIDDQFDVAVHGSSVRRRDLAWALDDLLAGRAVRTPATRAPGCLLGWATQPAAQAEVTYREHVAPLLAQYCVDCHQPGQVAPFAMVDYEEVRGWAPMIREVTQQRRMPPWYASADSLPCSNDCRLSQEQIDLLAAWVDAGAPEGDRSIELPPLAVSAGWRMAEPDQVFYMCEEPFEVPAQGPLDYQQFVIDPGNQEDLWIQAAEVHPGNYAVIHHVIVFIMPEGDEMYRNCPQLGYAPGMQPRVFPPGTALRIPAGAKLMFEIHYQPNGTVQYDRTYLGVIYADPATVKNEVFGGSANNTTFVIPPGRDHFKIVGRFDFDRDMQLLSFAPHMHHRGRSMRYELRYPDGRREMLFEVPNWDFNWQLWYDLKEPKFVPAGSSLCCTARYDNTAANRANPDPERAVPWGFQTQDEMMEGYFSAVAPVDSSSAPFASN